MAKKIKKHPCIKCAEIKKRKRGARPPVVRTQRKQAPVIINLQQPTAPYLPSLANQYMNMPFQGPPMGNQLARRVVPAVIPDDYVEPVLVVRAPSVQNSIRDSISDISDISPESYGYEGSLPSSLYQSEQSFRDYESLPPAPYQYPPSYPPSSYFQLPIQPPMPAFEPIGRQSNNLPSAPISFEDDFEQSLSKAEAELNAIFTPPVDFGRIGLREDDFSDMSLSEKSASIRSAKIGSDITIPPSLFEERTFVPAAEPILPSIAGIYDDLDLGLKEPIGKPIPDVIPPAEIPTALAMPISKGDDITPIKAINPALVEKLTSDDIRALNTFDEIKSIKKSERTPEQEKDFKRAQYLQTQQRGKVDAFRMSELYQPTYTPEKLAVGGGGGEGSILAEKVDDFSNYTAQDRSDLEKYRGAKDIKKSERTPEQQRIVDRVDKTLSKRKNYDDFLNSGKVITGGIPIASELVEDEPEKEPFFFEDKPITGSAAFNISKPITTKRQPSVFEERATVIPESVDMLPTELAPYDKRARDENASVVDGGSAIYNYRKDGYGNEYAVDYFNDEEPLVYQIQKDEDGNKYWIDYLGRKHEFGYLEPVDVKIDEDGNKYWIDTFGNKNIVEPRLVAFMDEDIYDVPSTMDKVDRWKTVVDIELDKTKDDPLLTLELINELFDQASFRSSFPETLRNRRKKEAAVAASYFDEKKQQLLDQYKTILNYPYDSERITPKQTVRQYLGEPGNNAYELGQWVKKIDKVISELAISPRWVAELNTYKRRKLKEHGERIPESPTPVPTSTIPKTINLQKK